jgi:hypothetical protein
MVGKAMRLGQEGAGHISRHSGASVRPTELSERKTMNEIGFSAAERACGLTKEDVLARAFAIPFNNPAYPPAPDKFFDRPALTVSYRTDLDKVRGLVPEPLVIEEPIVSLTFCSWWRRG